MENIEKITLKKEQSDFKKIKITGSKDSANYIRQFYFDDLNIYESFFILLLNRQNETIGYAKISQGGITGTVVDPKIVAKYIVDSFATGVILCHNHPSGNLKASEQDKYLTERLSKIAELLDSKILDHIILTENDYYSFLDEGLI